MVICKVTFTSFNAARLKIPVINVLDLNSVMILSEVTEMRLGN